MSFNAAFRWVLVVWTVAFCASYAAEAEASESHFQAGIAAFRKNDFKAARASFIEALKEDEDNPVLLHNLATTVQKEGEIGLALGLWRKALAIDPGFTPARRAIEWTESKLERKDIPRDVTYWESFRASVLSRFSLDLFLGATAVLFLFSGWIVLRYLGERRRAFLEERPLPKFPVTAVFGVALFLASVFLSASKAYDGGIERGTIVAKKVEVRSSPDPSATALFDLYEGFEVIVRQNAKDWTQVTYPGGSTGWIPDTAVFTTIERAAL